MYKIEWDKETGGVLLNTRITNATIGIAPRPVFYEELDLLGLDKLGYDYPHCKEPIMWAINKQYWYRGEHLLDAKGANIYTKPTLEFCSGEPKPCSFKAVEVERMLERTNDLMFVLENEAIEFIRDTYATYTNANQAYEKADANKMDFEALAEKAAKSSKQQMAVVKQDCDSFDIMPLSNAEQEGKKVLLSTKIDKFIASFSGGKDSQVVLDLCTRAIPPTDFEVIYSDTGYELPPSLELYKQVEAYYKERFPALKFHLVRNHESVLNYWDTIGTPSDTHRWCCSIMKTAPLYKMLKIEGNKQARVLSFDGVRSEESIKRENYQREGKGKHTNVFNAHPILKWNAAEIYLYLFRYNLPINKAYRYGKSRVGCLICPFSTAWDDMVINSRYPDDLAPFVEKLKQYSSQVKLFDLDKYLCERSWKLKPLANRNNGLPFVAFKSDINAVDFVSEISDSRLSIHTWLPALCDYSVREVPNGFVGELHYKKEIFPFEIKTDGNKTTFVVSGKPNNNLVFLLRRLIYKTAYCINCEVCEVDCPTGALSINPTVNINKDKCIHCHKCFLSHDRGCIAADCSRMITDTEKKLSAKIQAYKKFGLKEEWIDEYFIDTEIFHSEHTMGTAQYDSVKAWLRDIDVTDAKNKITPMGLVLRDIFQNSPSLFWEIAFINLSYKSYIVNWFCNNIKQDQIYNTKLVTEEIANMGYCGSLSTISNAAIALVDYMKKNPTGIDMMQGVIEDKAGLRRCSYDDLSIEAIAYSVYKYAETNDITMFRVSDLYRETEEHGVYKEFCITKEALLKKLRTISANPERVIVAELNMGLEHITIREDLSSLDVLKVLAL